MSPDDTNREIMMDFLDESLDSLNEAENLFVVLESSPDDLEVINSIFRPFHSLKGNSAYFGLMKIKQLSHAMEDLLDLIRNGRRKPDRKATDVLLPGLDLLKKMLESARNDGPEVPDTEKYNRVLNGVLKAVESGDTEREINPQELKSEIDTLRGFITPEGGDSIKRLTRLLAPLMQTEGESDSKDTGQNSNSLPEPVKELLDFLKKESGNYKEASSELEENLKPKIEKVREYYLNTEELPVVESILDIFETFANADTGIDNLALSMITENAEKLRTPAKESVPEPSQEIPAEKKQEQEIQSKAKKRQKPNKSMRIPEKSLDDFLKYVGELLGVEEMFRHISQRLYSDQENHELAKNMKDVVKQFETISKELRTKIMDIRKVEAKVLLQKAPRIVRDIASSSGKEIEVIIQGEETKIDKSYIDLLDAPLTHMVRNAADHGIEASKERKRKNKDEKGKITINIRESEEELIFSTSDDGAGLDYEALGKKAAQLGIVNSKEDLKEQDVIDLLFTSGVSTAEEVTDISGRGVGMDVVKKAVEDAGGTIGVQSTPGEGSCFSVSLPRNASTQIIDGYIVQNFNDDYYILPLSIILEAFAPESEDVSTAAGKGCIVSRHEKIYPYFSFDALIGAGTGCNIIEASDKGFAVLCRIRGTEVALSVKEAIGIQKIVKKPVEGGFMNGSLFEGASVSGTGRVMLIVSEEMLYKRIGK